MTLTSLHWYILITFLNFSRTTSLTALLVWRSGPEGGLTLDCVAYASIPPRPLVRQKTVGSNPGVNLKLFGTKKNVRVLSPLPHLLY